MCDLGSSRNNMT